MTQSENEKELVLGNKQLVSFFLVVLALCGVFFALGYMIGRNSTKTAVLADDTRNPATGGTVSPMPPSQAPTATSELPPAVPAAIVESPGQTQTQAARESPPTREIAPTEQLAGKTKELTKEVTKELPAAREMITPEPGAMYLQVTALRRGDAESLVRTLREQSFPALLATSSKPDLFRVMVGPYRQTAQVADAKARLKTLGFGDAILKK